MKNIRNKFLALLLITSVAFLSCKKEDPLAPMRANATSSTPNSIITTDNPLISDADWQIASFQIGEFDNTKLFSDYAFKFDKEGVIVAVTRRNSVTGTWAIGVKENADKLTITFPNELPLSKLNYEWRIVNRTATELKLEKFNRKEMEQVIFQRNQRQTELGQLN